MQDSWFGEKERKPQGTATWECPQQPVECVGGCMTTLRASVAQEGCTFHQGLALCWQALEAVASGTKLRGFPSQHRHTLRLHWVLKFYGGMTGERVPVCRGSRAGSRGTAPRTEVSREEFRASVGQTVRSSPHPGGSQLPTLPGLHSTAETGACLETWSFCSHRGGIGLFLFKQKRHWWPRKMGK